MKLMTSSAIKLLFFTSVFSVLSAVSLAQDSDDYNVPMRVAHGVYVGVGSIGLDKNEAYRQGVDDVALLFDAGYQVAIGSYLDFRLGVYAAVIDDEDPFEELVDDDDYWFNNHWTDNSRWESSDIEAWGVVLEASGRFPINNVLSLGGGLGYRTLSASREITFCDNCYSEDVDLDGGTYFRPYINIDTGRFNIQFSYTTFMSGGFTHGANVNFIWSF